MSAVQLRGFNCPNCGAAIQLRGFQFAQSVVCDSCLAVLDASDANVAVLQKFAERTLRYAPLIPLGSRGIWKGDPWEVIGFQVRQISVEDTDYHWQEYLLFNPFRGFRYLSEYEGHWSDIVSVRGLPKVTAGIRQPTVRWHDTTFKQFQTAIATTVFALGEFPWMVHVGDIVTVRDFVAPPFMLSSEETESEVTWSLGEYAAGARLREAFAVPDALPAARGVFASQPNPHAGSPGRYWWTFFVLLLFLVALVAVRTGSAGGRTVAHAEGTYHPGVAADKAAFVPAEFALEGRTSNVVITTSSTVNGSWLYVGMSLVNDETGQVINVGREVSYYAGVDGGESWSEGSRIDDARISAVPSGKWFLRVEFDGPDAGTEIDWIIDVRRDIPGFLWWAIALGVFLLPPVFVTFRSAAFETTRWAESDFAPRSSSNDDDSDSSDSDN